MKKIPKKMTNLRTENFSPSQKPEQQSKVEFNIS